MQRTDQPLPKPSTAAGFEPQQSETLRAALTPLAAPPPRPPPDLPPAKVSYWTSGRGALKRGVRWRYARRSRTSCPLAPRYRQPCAAVWSGAAEAGALTGWAEVSGIRRPRKVRWPRNGRCPRSRPGLHVCAAYSLVRPRPFLCSVGDALDMRRGDRV